MIFLISFLSKDANYIDNISSPVITIFAPAQKLMSNINKNIGAVFETIPQFFNLKQENEKMRQTVAELEHYRQKYIEYKEENTHLRAMLGFKQRNAQYELEAAEVIGRDSGNWFNIILIDKGLKDGLKKDMAVVTEEGLVGCIITAGENYSKVLLLIDERSSVSAMIQRTRDNGILKGTIAPAPMGCVKMVFLPHDASLVKGDVVISSGLGGIIPKGIEIGEIIEVKKEPYELMQYAIVKPAVDFHKLERVFVIKNQGEQLPVEGE